MRWPARLSRKKSNVHKNDFGHVLVIAGSPRMLGANALCSLAAMRCGTGLVTSVVPKGLNKSLQAKLSSVVMSWPLPETSDGTLAFTAWKDISKSWSRYQACVIGPGLSTHPQTVKLILRVIADCPMPLVVDADALNALVGHLSILEKRKAATILTPHPGEMKRLSGRSVEVDVPRKLIAQDFVRNHACVLVLKGHRTIVAEKNRKVYVNSTGNAGMATAGSGDVLAGMIGALLAQGLDGFEAAQLGVYAHGLAGDLAAKQQTKVSLIATDIIEKIPQAIQRMQK